MITVKDGNAADQNLKTTLLAGEHTPHHIIDNTDLAKELKQDVIIAALTTLLSQTDNVEGLLAAIQQKIIDTPATEGLQNILARLVPPATTIPIDSAAPNAAPVRVLPQKVDRFGFANAIANGVNPAFFSTVGGIGAGMTVDQTGGNLVIGAGVTPRSETIIRSNESWIGSIRKRVRLTLSQRIINNNFFIELVDVIGDALTYNITSATAIEVTIPNNPFTAVNVEQSMFIGGFAGTGTFISGRYTIASVAGNVVTFTVAGFAVGTGTCSLFGWNYYQQHYTGTVATNLNFQTQRQGYANAAIVATINTTAAPGLMTVLTVNDCIASLSDQLVTSGTFQRANQNENIPDDVPLRLQIRVANGTVAPASNTTLTIGAIYMANFAAQDVSVQDVRPINLGSGLPVEILRGAMVVSGTVTANIGTTNTVVLAATTTPLAASGIFTSMVAELSTGGANLFARYVVRAFADVPGTLRIEQSIDGVTYRRVTPDMPLSAAGTIELESFGTARFMRAVFVNGGTAQTAFMLTHALFRI